MGLLLPIGIGAAEGDEDLLDLDLEALLEVQIELVSRRSESAFTAPAAITVLDHEQIARSGHQHLAEVFRLVPGMQVARLSANTWSVSTRGFMDKFVNTQQILIDGRSAYMPLFGGVFWDVQDLILEDVARIEVIKGPGGSLWGSNAVNGILNVVSKDSADTQGLYLSQTLGVDSDISRVRYGGRSGEELAWRIGGLHVDGHPSQAIAGGRANDAWELSKADLRADWSHGPLGLALHGGIYSGNIHNDASSPVAEPPFLVSGDRAEDVSGGHLGGKLHLDWADGSRTSLRLFWDRVERHSPAVALRYDTTEVDLQHSLQASDHLDLVLGTTWRLQREDNDGGANFDLEPSKQDIETWSLFAQASCDLLPDELELTIGGRYEEPHFTDEEWQGSLRLAWQPVAEHVFWAAVSRAVRMPSSVEENGHILAAAFPAGPLVARVELFPYGDMEAVELTAYEAGWRWQALEDLHLDLATFHFHHDGLTSEESAGPSYLEGVPPQLVMPLQLVNDRETTSWGAELACTWRVSETVDLRGSWAWIDGDDDFDGVKVPEHTAQLIAGAQLDPRLRVDLSATWVDEIEGSTTFSGADQDDIDDYLRIDLRLGWRPLDEIEMALGIQNLLEDHHQEFFDGLDGSHATEVPRNVYLQLDARF